MLRADRTARFAASGRCRHDSGSALMLMPAAVLIVLVLGAIAFDLSHRHLAERQLRTLAADAANDAVAAGLDAQRLRAEGVAVLDPVAATEAAQRSVAAHRPGGIELVDTRVAVTEDAVEVTLSARVPATFARALPGGGEALVHAQAGASPTRR